MLGPETKNDSLTKNKTGKTFLKRLRRQNKAKDFKKDCKRLQKISKD